MTKYTGQELWDAAKAAGFSAVPLAGQAWAPAQIIAAVALAESGGDNQATALTSKEHSVGVYQINLYAHPDITEAAARDLQTSSSYVYHLSKQGTDFSPWTMYKNGGYKQFLPLPGATGQASVPASPVASGGQDVSGGTVAANPSILGIVLPSDAEWQQAGIVAGVTLLALLLLAGAVYGFVQQPAEQIVKAVA